MKIAVIGGGNWGTALANLLAGKGYVVSVLFRDMALAFKINTEHVNIKYLPSIKLHSNFVASVEPEFVLEGADIVLLATPCQSCKLILAELKDFLPKNCIIVSATKGLEIAGKRTIGQIVEAELGRGYAQYAVLSGPSFALEVIKEEPTAVVLACQDLSLGKFLQEIFSTNLFRVYLSSDIIGVELGGALKNVMAIAVGLSDGLGFGYNARAALMTRGLAEMSRFGLALGANIKTFMGLSGMGDLVLTCTGDLSRNRQVGLKLGAGLSLAEIQTGMYMVSEGVTTTKAVYEYARDLQVDLPITQAVYNVLYENRDPEQVVSELMTRKLKEE